MAYDAALADSISRIRFALGDAAEIELFPDATYSALMTLNGGSEEATIRQAAAALAVQFAQQPDHISDLGSSLSWTDRVDQWNRIASGRTPLVPSDSTLIPGGVQIGRILAGSGYVPR